MDTILKTIGISKSFSGIEVLHSVDFELIKGSIHAIIGENGAGKSTLMKIIMGIHHPDAGIILLNGKEVHIPDPRSALNYGIAMVQQELYDMPYMSVCDYMYLGREPRKFGFLDKDAKRQLVQKQLENLNLDIDLDTQMGTLNISDVQMVEIAKAISYGSYILILDEPTSSLSEIEVERLFSILQHLKKTGVSVIYISHRLEELYKISDQVTILRDGYKVLSDNIFALSREELISKMVGHKIEEIFPKLNTKFGDVAIRIEDMSKTDEFYDINFSVRYGEVVGLAGLVGAGRTEIATAIFGVNKINQGKIFINDKHVRISNAGDAISRKIGFLTEDRKLTGLNLKASIKDNTVMVILRKLSKFGFLKQNSINESVESMIKKLFIKCYSIEQPVKHLSGGNQQKVLLAKWLLLSPRILILDEPTRGIDVGSKIEIYRLINDLAKAGIAILLISSELPEIISLCNRVIVIREGKVSGEIEGSEISQKNIMLLASG